MALWSLALRTPLRLHGSVVSFVHLRFREWTSDDVSLLVDGRRHGSAVAANHRRVPRPRHSRNLRLHRCRSTWLNLWYHKLWLYRRMCRYDVSRRDSHMGMTDHFLLNGSTRRFACGFAFQGLGRRRRQGERWVVKDLRRLFVGPDATPLVQGHHRHGCGRGRGRFAVLDSQLLCVECLKLLEDFVVRLLILGRLRIPDHQLRPVRVDGKASDRTLDVELGHGQRFLFIQRETP